jgi:hypothetical protein
VSLGSTLKTRAISTSTGNHPNNVYGGFVRGDKRYTPCPKIINSLWHMRRKFITKRWALFEMKVRGVANPTTKLPNDGLTVIVLPPLIKYKPRPEH